MENTGYSEEDLDSRREQVPIRSGSPAPSVYSFHSSVDSKTFLRDCHGRVLNGLNELYMWPADDEERRRLDLQHEQYKRCIGSLYTARKLVQKVLAPRDPNLPPPAIIDVGTGSGSWAIDMAIEFPHCEVVGLDLAPNVVRPVPPNCRFEFDDANLGLPHYESKFDVIHARAIGGGITDFPKLHREFANTLRPGGVLLLADGDLQLFNKNKEPIPLQDDDDPDFSWTHRIFFAAYNTMKERGANVDSPYLNPTWLKEIEQFDSVENMIYFVPVGPWTSNALPCRLLIRVKKLIEFTDNSKEILISELNRTNVAMHLKGMKPLLVSTGYFEEAVDHMIAEAERELRELSVQLYTRWHFTWAVRNDLPNVKIHDADVAMA